MYKSVQYIFPQLNICSVLDLVLESCDMTDTQWPWFFFIKSWKWENNHIIVEKQIVLYVVDRYTNNKQKYKIQTQPYVHPRMPM